MAIAFNAATAFTQAQATSLTYAHNTTGGANVLVVVLGSQFAGDHLTGATYAGTTMRQVNKVFVGNTGDYMWALAPCTAGNNNVVITRDASDWIYSMCASYTDCAAVNPTTAPDANTTNTASAASSITTSVISVANNCWTVIVGDDGGINTGGAGTTIRNSAGDGLLLADSNAAITPAGSTSLILNRAGSNAWQVVMASFAPYVAPSGPTNLKSMDTVTKANIKSIDGVLIANIKSVNTVV